MERTPIVIQFTHPDGRKLYWRPTNMRPWVLPGGIVARRVDRRTKYQKKGKVKPLSDSR